MGDIEIKFNGGTNAQRAWNPEEQKQNITARSTYTQKIGEAEEMILPLDRFDDFSQLNIEPKHYEKKEGSPYGIELDRVKHSDNQVIRKKQQNAAHQMLRDLRGFGLLADVVGSGKTFEAGVVLSELAERDRISNMLIITPSQVFNDWVDVIENKFGLGKGTLVQLRGDDPADKNFNEVLNKIYKRKKSDKVIRPTKSVIVDVDVFSHWTIPDSVVFDVIVVDEAHHLCEEEGEYASAMRLLSQLMAIKKATGSQTYCLLLSATPHSGNLENMFRLWYFVRCRGGNPKDFTEQEDSTRSKGYLTEKEYYLKTMCRGATNVTDFIRKVKLQTITLQPYRVGFLKWLDGKGMSEEQFSAETEYARSNLIELYLKDNEAAKEKLLRVVAREYHALLRSIMIRQSAHSEGSGQFIAAGKFVKNIFFFPVPRSVYGKVSRLPLDGKAALCYSGEDLTLSLVPRVLQGQRNMTMEEYLSREVSGSGQKKWKYRELLTSVLQKLSQVYEEETKVPYTRSGYVNYYANRFGENFKKGFNTEDPDPWSQITVLPVVKAEGKLGYKYEYLKSILRKHAGERVIVFFDYDLREEESVIDSVTDALRGDKEFSKRLLLSDSDTREKVIGRFNKQSDAVLLVRDASLTEGANLHACNLIVNYQVSPDPLAMDQRIGRVFRLGQDKDVTIYSFADMDTLEGFALAYFVGIGLFNVNSGDATILAGSNNDSMVTVRCNLCGNVKLMSQQDHAEFKRTNVLICNHAGSRHSKECPALMKETEQSKRRGGDTATVACKCCGAEKTIPREEFYGILRSSPLICSHTKRFEGEDESVMNEINVHEFKCAGCGYTLRRSVSEEGYRCSAINRDHKFGRMSNSGKLNDRTLPCLKTCAMSHCSYLKKIGCPIIGDKYRGKSEAELVIACRQCAKCKAEYETCRILNDSVNACNDCRHAECNPKPATIVFNEKWEAACPSCGGKLRPQLPKTFAAYIRGLWNFQSGDNSDGSFCENLDKEAQKVEDVRSVLDMDEAGAAEV